MKSVQIRNFFWSVFSCLYFPVFGLNTEIYSVHLRIQPKYRKKQTRKNSAFEHFSRSADILEIFIDFHTTWATDYPSNKKKKVVQPPKYVTFSIGPFVCLSVLLSMM